jgi:hypothetical protein
MKHYINQFQGYTTVIVEIEDNIWGSDMPQVRKELESIGQIVFDTSLNIINKHDEDIHSGWKFVVLSNQNETCIQSVIDDIAEIFI